CSQIPDWLNTKNPKINLVDHTSYIDDKFLPTFNSNAIEISIHNIPNLSNNFVFFNDDFYINRAVKENDFFSKSGMPRDSGVLSPQIPIENSITSITVNDLKIINKYFSRNDIFKHFGKFFNFKYGINNLKTFSTLPWKKILGFYDLHIPISFNKTLMEKFWNLEKDDLSKVFDNKFRTDLDYNIWVYRYNQLLRGFFETRSTNFGKYYNISDNNENIIKDISKHHHHLIVLNDQSDIANFKNVRKELIVAFDRQYPKKSTFEN
ncbi:hypothetical protein ATW79_10015, partial [Oenococcus oeni]